MDDQSPIERYLVELDAELRLPARLRRRIVAEAREHLRESAGHVDAIDTTAQVKAIESFGTPAVVAAEFARELAIGSTHRAARWGGMLFLVSLILWDLCTSSFVHVAPSWINDGPGSALVWILGQVGFVAGVVTLARARAARRRNALDTARLRYAVRGVIVLAACTSITVLMSGAGAAVAVADSAARQTQILLYALLLASAALATASAAAACRAHRRLGALERKQLTATGREALADVLDALVDGWRWVDRHLPLGSVARIVRLPIGPAVRRALSRLDPGQHPWRYGLAVGLAAGLAVPLLDAVVLVIKGQLSGPQLADLAATAPALVGVETVLVIAGYAILGTYLGLRPTRQPVDG